MIKANKALIFKTLSDAKNNLDKIHHIDSNGFTALFFCENPDVISFLLEQGLDINHQSKEGYTPLMFAVRHPYDNYEKMRIFIDNGADLNLIDKHGQNALFGCNSLIYTEALVEAGININAIDKYGSNILFDCLDYEAYESFDYLLNKGVDASPVNDWGLNVLFNGSLGLKSIKRLIEAGANPHQISKEGKNVLSSVSSEDVMDFYVSIGVNPLYKDSEGNNLYFQQVQHYTEQFYPVLSKHGVDINAKNNKGQNIIDLLFSDIDDYAYIMDRIRPHYEKKINMWKSLGLIIDTETKKLIESKLYQ